MKRNPNAPVCLCPALPRRTKVLRCLGASLLGALVLTACSSFDAIDYYWQSATGEWQLLSSAKRIDDVIAGTDDQALKTRLARITEIRRFASTELGLPANGSYTRYTDLGRPFVTWTVFATPELSLVPRQWCFPVAGCVSYRGYFQENAAHEEARRLKADGDDVYVGAVPAYSTLGYFDDPVLSSFVNWPESAVARLIFHELAHQLIYVPGDTVFNESYAVTVERAGLKRWLAHEHDPKLVDQAARDERAQTEFFQLVSNVRERLAAIYSSLASKAEKRTAKLMHSPTWRARMPSTSAAILDSPGTAGGSRTGPTTRTSPHLRYIPTGCRRSRRSSMKKETTFADSMSGCDSSPACRSRTATGSSTGAAEQPHPRW